MASSPGASTTSHTCLGSTATRLRVTHTHSLTYYLLRSGACLSNVSSPLPPSRRAHSSFTSLPIHVPSSLFMPPFNSLTMLPNNYVSGGEPGLPQSQPQLLSLSCVDPRQVSLVLWYSIPVCPDLSLSLRCCVAVATRSRGGSASPQGLGACECKLGKYISYSHCCHAPTHVRYHWCKVELRKCMHLPVPSNQVGEVKEHEGKYPLLSVVLTSGLYSEARVFSIVVGLSHPTYSLIPIININCLSFKRTLSFEGRA